MTQKTFLISVLLNVSAFGQTDASENIETDSSTFEIPVFNHMGQDFYSWFGTVFNCPEDPRFKKETILYLMFIIDSDGTPHSFKFKKKLFPPTLIQKEILRTLATMPKWTPAKEDGKNVASELILPFRIRINDPAEGFSKQMLIDE